MNHAVFIANDVAANIPTIGIRFPAGRQRGVRRGIMLALTRHQLLCLPLARRWRTFLEDVDRTRGVNDG